MKLENENGTPITLHDVLGLALGIGFALLLSAQKAKRERSSPKIIEDTDFEVVTDSEPVSQDNEKVVMSILNEKYKKDENNA